jgi:hypothetical protein
VDISGRRVTIVNSLLRFSDYFPQSVARSLCSQLLLREAGAHQRLGTRKIVDQLEAPAAGHGTRHHPVADLVRIIAGAHECVVEERASRIERAGPCGLSRSNFV